MNGDRPTPKRKRLIGSVTPQLSMHHAECSECAWQIRKRAHDDALTLLRSHYRIAHGNGPTLVYLED